jgi:hypothetical protein
VTAAPTQLELDSSSRRPLRSSSVSQTGPNRTDFPLRKTWTYQTVVVAHRVRSGFGRPSRFDDYGMRAIVGQHGVRRSLFPRELVHRLTYALGVRVVVVVYE